MTNTVWDLIENQKVKEMLLEFKEYSKSKSIVRTDKVSDNSSSVWREVYERLDSIIKEKK